MRGELRAEVADSHGFGFRIAATDLPEDEAYVVVVGTVDGLLEDLS